MREPGGSITYVPALDGLRAVAVGVVLLFHAGVGWASGGFFGVSVFFTLSGYLITSLLLAEQRATGGIDLRAFYARRLRRLLPAAYLCLVFVVALSALWGAGQRRNLPGDVFAAVGNVSNWRFAYNSASYADLFIGGPSPLAHFWSLAIEEQCYLVLPLVAWLFLRRGVGAFAVALAVLLAGSVLATVLTDDPDLLYYGTHTRAFELLVGAALAVVMSRRSLGIGVRSAAGGLGVVALVVAVAGTTVSTGWLYRGGLSVFAFASVGLVLGATGQTLLARVLAWQPLVAVGTVSYGLYLFHWPIFLALSPERTGWSLWPLLVVRLVCTGACAVLSARLLELPVRQRRVLRGARPALATLGAAMVAIVLLGQFAVPAARLSATEALLAQGEQGVVEFASAAPAVAGSTIVASAPTVLLVGSNPQLLAPLRAAGLHVIDGLQASCQIAAVEPSVPLDGQLLGTSECEPSAQRWARLITAHSPAVVVVAAGALDTGEVVRPNSAGLYVEDDLVAEADRMTAALQAVGSALDVVHQAGVPLVLFDSVPTDRSTSNLDQFALHLGISGGVHRSIDDTVAAAQRLATGAPEAVAATRVLVLGDSTSLNVAKALNDGSDGTLTVTWAGANGCPFVPVTATRPAGGEWTHPECEVLLDQLPGLLAQVRPMVVLLVVGPTELQQQQYLGDDAAHVAGDPGFQAAHDAQMAAVAALLPDGVQLLVADAPPLVAGKFSTPEMAAPGRLAAWNAQVARWDAAWPNVQLWPYAAVIAGYEAAHGSIRPDGTHPEVGALTQLAREQLVPMLLAAVAPTP